MSRATIDEEYEALVKSTLPAKVIAEDRRLTKLEAESGESLGALRYEWCVVRGMTQRAYAEAVGVAPANVAKAITRYLERHPDLVLPRGSTSGNARQQSAKKREAAKREPKVSDEVPAGINPDNPKATRALRKFTETVREANKQLCKHNVFKYVAADYEALDDALEALTYLMTTAQADYIQLNFRENQR